MNTDALEAIRYQRAAVAPQPGCRRTMHDAFPTARFCTVFSQGNSIGWRLFPPFDAEVTWRGSSEFEVTTNDAIGEFLWRNKMRELIGIESNWWCSKIPGVLQVDVGMAFRTNPLFKLLLQAPNNQPSDHYWVHAGVLDSDWFHVPSTVNITPFRQNVPFQLMRNSPIAQLILVGATTLNFGQCKVTELSSEDPALAQWRQYIEETYGEITGGSSLPPRIQGTYCRWKRAAEVEEG
jgi:hypothetical protein